MRRPHENTYWVEPGRLLAGEFPGAWNERDAAIRLGLYLECGVTDFIDLTVPQELDSYEALLVSVARERGTEAGYRRFSIPDMDVPEKPAIMIAILDHLDDLLTGGGVPYVHCWGGIGRTGTVVGCYLVRSGLTGEQALDRLAEMWRGVAKSSRYRTSPQTWEQFDYVRTWRE